MTTIPPALDERVITVPAIAGISSDAALVAVWAAAAAVPAGGVFPVGCLTSVQAAADLGAEWSLTGMALLAAGQQAAVEVDADSDSFPCQRPHPGTLAYGLGSSEATIAGQAVVIRGAGSAPIREAAARAAVRWLEGERALPLWETVQVAADGIERIPEAYEHWDRDIPGEDAAGDPTGDTDDDAARAVIASYEEAAEW